MNSRALNEIQLIIYSFFRQNAVKAEKKRKDYEQKTLCFKETFRPENTIRLIRIKKKKEAFDCEFST